MAALKLPKAARLSRRADFRAVREQGNSWHGRLIVLGGLRTDETGAAKLGVITTRRVGSAVERTRLRRRLREVFRLQRPLLPAGLWMVIVPRRAAVNAQFAALAEEWRVLSVRAGFLKA
jgi:ribonuclease P protein component